MRTIIPLKANLLIPMLLCITLKIVLGSVIAVEDPYVALLYNEVDWDTKHCHCCLKRICRGIPCKTCVFVSKCLYSKANFFKALPGKVIYVLLYLGPLL